MTARTALKTLLALVLGLPLLQMVLMWVANLLTALGDTGAITVLGHVNTGARVLWLVSVVGLIVLLAVQAVERDEGE